MKMLKFVTKNALFGYFWAGIWKKHCDIWNQQPRICLAANFGKKQKCLNLGPKMHWVFLGWNLKTILSYLESSPSNLSNCKILWKNENAYIWDKKCLIWVFLDWNFKKLLSYLKSAPSDLPNFKIPWKNENA